MLQVRKHLLLSPSAAAPEKLCALLGAAVPGTAQALRRRGAGCP